MPRSTQTLGLVPRVATRGSGAAAEASAVVRALGEPLGNVSYRVRQLEKAGLIELVATRQPRGARALLHARVIDERDAAVLAVTTETTGPPRARSASGRGWSPSSLASIIGARRA
jgi:hypothetical protein